MFYLWIKFIHIISSTLLFGTGLGTACVMLYAHNTRDINIIAAMTRYVVLADWIFTAPSALIQLISGLAMVYIAGFSFTLFWIWGSLIGYFIAMCCWLVVVYLQIKMGHLARQAKNSNRGVLPDEYHQFFKYWFWLGWPAFISLIIIFYLMTNKPF